ncbi:aldehyde dehydrogenase family protein [Jatrophihabitans sp.]|uniref:aldehyde dehydrogenase family protein n=1 Tax=Jatrophihabitans sp. TaxID=1932789 RepID=UPI0030C73CCE|nr:aldA 1 [Jatrophihabitans sp.]
MSTDLETPMGTTRAELADGMYVDGRLVPVTGTRTYQHVNPATGRVQKEFGLASTADAETAMRSSATAFQSWKRVAPAERSAVLHRIAATLREQTETLAEINALEVGTPLNFGRWAVADAAAWFDYYAGWTDKITGDTIPVPQEEGLDFTVYEPVGVVVKVLTWNTPIGGISMSVAAALAAGCTVVLKPAEQAPFAAVEFARICTAAGVPDGVVNVVVGDREAGDYLVRHPGVGKVSFTGGTATGSALQAAAAENVTPLVLELGGKSAHLVFADADLASATAFNTVVTALSGQGCSLPTRLLVERSVFAEVLEQMVALLGTVSVGDPFAADVQMGPVLNEAALERILTLVADARAAGATCALGGERLGGELAEGFYVGPTVLVDVEPGSDIAQREVFGPVLSVFAFDTEEEAIELANSTRFGLAAYVHTSDLSRALRLARELEAGGVGINGKMLPATYAAPFGGIGASGYGREGGRAGIEEFLRIKNVAIKF